MRTLRALCRVPHWTATLTWKATAFLAVMCCGLAALLGVLVHVSVTNQTVGEARGRALDRLTEATAAYEEGDRLPPGAGVDLPGLPAPLRELATDGRRGTMVGDQDTHPTMWAAGPADRGRALAVQFDYAQGAHAIDALDRAIVWSSALAIGATLLVGAFAVTRVTRRLHATARVARRISAGDLDARVNDPRTVHDSRTAYDSRGVADPRAVADPRRQRPARPQDEVAAVAGALDTMAASLQSKLLSEQRFTADVAHELRTPLTGLHAAAELLPPGRPTELVRDRVATLRTLTEDLLEISRLDAGRERLELDSEPLAPLAGRVVRASGTETEVRVVRDTRVETDRRRLERVLGNLVANAHKHGRAPVALTVDGPVVTVRDHGDGYPDYLLEHGPQRFRTEGGSKGHGLGLTIALGQAEVLGARLMFTNAPDGGALATLTLPRDERDDREGPDEHDEQDEQDQHDEQDEHDERSAQNGGGDENDRDRGNGP
ncbi:HAMP domain-containing histidine kinase [Streptomyces sp. NBC_01571]|uniref:sensor histidine kinase n=1 Tax=Streptomyces sp. NBC_01571 TaxID=2975883 RepID=UPI002257C472|nr:HAMP domain-containing sensor histidine kinase [Streptomyces sp. NBC_01571]MCX4577484.1 HAMP domain-containing histidine kinase [Streptomyces sp. NBC_01571]